jgi:hypothetical protein
VVADGAGRVTAIPKRPDYQVVDLHLPSTNGARVS